MAEQSWTFTFTDSELTAIYDAIENTDTGDFDREVAYDSVIEKITPARVGGPPAGVSVTSGEDADGHS